VCALILLNHASIVIHRKKIYQQITPWQLIQVLEETDIY